jgi:hypothetical protein
MNQDKGFRIDGVLSVISQNIVSKIDFSGGDPERNLSEEELKFLIKDCRAALETVFLKHFPEIETVGTRL